MGSSRLEDWERGERTILGWIGKIDYVDGGWTELTRVKWQAAVLMALNFGLWVPER